jgi:hypothetical protein
VHDDRGYFSKNMNFSPLLLFFPYSLLESGYTMREITEQISRIDRERQAKSLGLTKQIMKKTKNSVAKFVGKRSA